jgi:hypothetical protein
LRFVAFDVLVLDGDIICDASYRRRRAALESLGLLGASWCTVRSLDAKPRELLDVGAELHVEGVVAKRVDGAYRPGFVRRLAPSCIGRAGSSSPLGLGGRVAAVDTAGSLRRATTTARSRGPKASRRSKLSRYPAFSLG